MSGVAVVDFAGGPSLRFRIDPESIDWNFKILTSVTETLGGRVIQVIGATLSDLTITGKVGEQRGSSHMESWRLAEGFFAKIASMMDFQSRGSNGIGKMAQPATFTYPPLDIRLACYIKSITDADGQGSVSHKQGKFSYGYQLILFIVPEGSGDLKVAGTDASGFLNVQRQKAIENAMNRIADGIGWKYSDKFNGPSLNSGIGGTEAGVTITHTNGGQVPVKTVTLPGTTP